MRCLNPSHDHTTYADGAGGTLAAPAPVNCVHCGSPAHYDTTCEDYVHDNGPACPLARADDESNPCQQ